LWIDTPTIGYIIFEYGLVLIGVGVRLDFAGRKDLVDGKGAVVVILYKPVNLVYG
jgi:hypothetical protein